MDVKSLIKVNAQVFNLVHYVGLSPLKWNPVTEKFYEVRSKWYKLLWLTLLSVFTILEVAIVLNFIVKKIYFTPFDISRNTDGVHVIMTFVYMLTTAMHCYTVFWRDEIIQLINGLHLYFVTFSDTNFVHPPKRNFAAMFMASQAINLVGLCFGVTIMFIGDCKFHLLLELIPVCQPNSMKHYSIPWVISMSFIQFIMTVYVASSAIIITALGSAIDVFGLQILKEIMKIKDSAYYVDHPIKKHTWWSKHYKCWLLLIQFTNYNLCPMLPCIFSFYMSVQTILLYAMITHPDETIESHVGNILFQLVVLFCYFVTPYCASLFVEKAEEIVETEKRNCKSKYRMKIYKSLLPMRSVIGGFGYIEKLTVFSMLQTVVGKTIDLIIMTRTANT